MDENPQNPSPIRTYYWKYCLRCLTRICQIRVLLLLFWTELFFRLIGFCVIRTLWLKCTVLTLYMSAYYIYPFIWFMLSLLLSIDIINFIISCCCCCCLIIFLFQLVVVVLVLLLILFYCHLSVLCCLCCQCSLAPCYSFASITL